MHSSFVTLDRKILEWEWYTDSNTMRLFIHCLIKANWKEKEWMGTTIKRGSFITSGDKLSDQLNLSRKQIITSLKKLKQTGEIITKGHNKYTLVTIIKYDDYQKINKEEGQQRDNKGTTKAQQRDTTNNNNNNNNTTKGYLNYKGVAQNFEDAMENEQYVSFMMDKYQMSKGNLEKYYLEFNDHLEQTLDTVKSTKEYVAHFINWYCNKYKVDRQTGRPKLRRKNSL
jgi:biotin operon repressor